jgi:hypothetical protein
MCRLEEEGQGFSAAAHWWWSASSATRSQHFDARDLRRHDRSTTCPRGKFKLGRPGSRVNSVAGLLTVRIDVSKPADAAVGDGFEILAVIVQELKIRLFVGDAGNCRWALGNDVRNPNVCRWPSILRSDRRTINFCVRQAEDRRRGEMTHLVKVHLLSPTQTNKVSQVVQDVWPRVLA